MGGGTGAVFTIEGGTINATRIDPQNAVTFTMSGGTINISPTTASTRSNFGSFELFSTTSTFTMSGGTINLIQAAVAATPIDLQIRSISTITGGIVNVGTAATVTNFTFRVRGSIPSRLLVEIDRVGVSTRPGAPLNFGGTQVGLGSVVISGVRDVSLAFTGYTPGALEGRIDAARAEGITVQ